MDILGNGGNGKSILGTSGGGGGGGGGTVMKSVKTVFTFNAQSTDLKSDLQIIDGKLLLKDTEQSDVRFSNGSDTATRGKISYNDTIANVHYEVDKFKLTSAENEKVMITDKQGYVGFNKDPDPSYQVDLSGSLNITGGGTIYQEGYDILFNLGKLFDYLTKPPPAFEYNDTVRDRYGGTLSIQRTSFNITLFWRKGDNYDTSYNFGLEMKTLPYIDKIGVEIIDNVDGTGTLKEWVKVEPSDINGSDVSYVFDIDTSYTDRFGNQYTVNKNSSFNLRVYPINSTVVAGQVPNYLVFYDLSFVGPSPPTAPQNLSVALINGQRQKSFQLNFVKPLFNDSVIGVDENVSDKPPLQNYKIEYQPRSTDCNRFPQVYDTSLIELIRDGTNATTQYIIQDDNDTNIVRVYPGTTYDISLSAKNDQTENYGAVSNVSVKTNNPTSNDFKPINLTSINFTGASSITQFRIANTDIISSKKYFNINSDTLGTSNNTNTVFVNYTKLGVDSSGVLGLAFANIYHKVNTVEYVDASIVFHGYQSTDYDNGYHGTFETSTQYGTQLEFINVSNRDANVYTTRPEYDGFGLIGSYQIMLTDVIGQTEQGVLKFSPSTDEYMIGYRVNGTNINKAETNTANVAMSFYVDDLSQNPEIEVNGDGVNTDNAIQYVYCYGIPSIKSFRFDLSWNTSMNGRYVLPYGGTISRLVNQKTSIVRSITNNDTQTYTTTTIPKDQIFNHSYQQTLYFTTMYDSPTINDVYKLYSYNLLKNTDALSTTNTHSIQVPIQGEVFYCDYQSFTKIGNQINQINSFGKDDIYTYSTGNTYRISAYNTTSGTPANNQLIYYNSRFVNPIYTNHPYREFNIYQGKNITYSEFASTGDNVDGHTVKWLVKKFSNVSVGSTNQIRQLLITDNNGTHYTYSNYHNRLYILQFYAGYTDDTNRVSGWLDLNSDFNSLDTIFKQDRGVRNSNNNFQFYLYAEDGKIFDIYVRIGLINNSNTQTYIENLVLN